MTQELTESNHHNLVNVQTKKTYRIAIVHPSAGVNWSGGTEIFAIEIANRLSPYFEIELLAGASCSPYFYPAGGIPRTKARNLVSNPVVNRLLKSFSTHPDIVIEHLTNFIPCATRLLREPADLIFPLNDYGGLAMASVVRKILGTPILFKAHTGLTGGGKSLVRSMRFNPDHLVVFSNTMAEFVRGVNPHQSTTVIANGVDIDWFKPSGDRIEHGLGKPLVLCVASLNRRDHKRVELAIRAVARLPQVSLMIAGDGPDREYFQTLGEELLGSDRFAIKTFPFNQMPEVYRCADIFTLPSLDEPFGQAYIQAMACGLPVVATDDEIRSDIVGDAGILCDVTQLDIYADAIAKVLKSNWQEKARENALRFSWDAIAKSYYDVIVKTINQSKK
ncbi:MAG: glycosyltransferase [Calothrix sp. MO_167.B12]|nr:glycosyltransferase [Calothrix sp. MO_167.B12]